MEPISGLEYVMLTKITILQGRAGKVFFHRAGWGRARPKICGAGHQRWNLSLPSLPAAV